jgi:putative IMPACT (imprinted ancient) family translation regulator
MAQSISSAVESERIIKKSRSIGCGQPVPDRASAQAIVASLQAQHPGAEHVCWSLMAGQSPRFPLDLNVDAMDASHLAGVGFEQ